MNKKIILVLAFVLLFCGCSEKNDKKKISIAVMGSEEVYSQYYIMGVQEAIEQVNIDYKDSGFEIECKIYDDANNYDTADKMTANILEDESITAIIASCSPDISQN